MKHNYKFDYDKLLDKYDTLADRHDELIKEFRLLVNYILRIKKKCDSEKLWLMASIDPHKELTDDQQQGPMISHLFELVLELKKRLK